MPLRRLLVVSVLLGTPALCHAWDYEGHRIINQLALAGLPADFPAFVRTSEAAARIVFLSGEPDRWRNQPDLPLKQVNGMDHYLDIEQLTTAGFTSETVSPLRYEFATQFATARAQHPEKFPIIDLAKNADHSREWPGFLPWAITENYAKLKSAFSSLKAYQEAGTPVEIANAHANALYVMGVMGHYVGDGAQPLHTTIHTNGWIGDNPHGYTTWNRFHAWIDGGFIGKIGLQFSDVSPKARAAKVLVGPPEPEQRDPMFDAVMHYLLVQHERVVPLYELDKARKLKADSAENNGEGRAFFEEQFLRGGEMLGSIWLTAWRNSGPDTYLRTQLLKRQSTATP